MKAMLLTAGLGTRLRPVTDHYAKPAVPFLNIPLLDYPIALLEEAKIQSLVLNTHYKPEQIANISSEIPAAHFTVHLSPEPGAPLGSGGGIWKAKSLLTTGGGGKNGESDFIVANGDEVILPHEAGVISRFINDHKSNRALATILVMKHPLVGIQFGGVWADASGNVKGFGKDRNVFEKSTDGEITGYHYIGLLLLNERVFNYLPDGESNILYDALAKAIAAGEKVRAFVSNFTWFETGNAHDFLHASGEGLRLLTGTAGDDKKFLEKITDRFWTPGTRIEKTPTALILRGVDCRIENDAELKGFVVLGDGCRVEKKSFIENSVLLPGAQVKPGAIIRDQILV
jgi:mannose-1-phosphate guanylyltransferase